MINIARAFVELMDEYGVTAYRIAKNTGFTQSYLSQIRHGKRIPNTGTIEKLAKGIGCDPAELLRNYPDEEAADK